MLSWSLRLGRLAGIPVYVHWTFWLLIGWIVFMFSAAHPEAPLMAAMIGVGFVFALFGCVVLHELGHALTARKYGVPTRDITLLPIGGVARLQRMPEQPLQEFVVAIAGPAVNVVIAAVLATGLLAFYGPAALLPGPVLTHFFPALLWANMILVLFNLLPAFPMDGGRALRALLATRMDYLQATNIAASLGQGMAILFGIAAIFTFPQGLFLLFIALFVYLGAEAEARFAQVRVLLQGVPVRDAMLTHFRSLHTSDTLDTAVDALLSDPQQDFPVVDDYGRFQGMLMGDALIRQLRSGHRDALVEELMEKECRTIDDREMMDRALSQMQEASCNTFPVMRDGELAGMITLQNLSHFLTLRSAQRQQQPVAPEEVGVR